MTTDDKLKTAIYDLTKEYGYLGVGKALVSAIPRDRRVTTIGALMQLRLDDGTSVPNRELAAELMHWQRDGA